MNKEVRRHVLLATGIGFLFMVATLPIGETKPGMGWLRYGFPILLFVAFMVALVWWKREDI